MSPCTEWFYQVPNESPPREKANSRSVFTETLHLSYLYISDANLFSSRLRRSCQCTISLNVVGVRTEREKKLHEQPFSIQPRDLENRSVYLRKCQAAYTFESQRPGVHTWRFKLLRVRKIASIQSSDPWDGLPLRFYQLFISRQARV